MLKRILSWQVKRVTAGKPYDWCVNSSPDVVVTGINLPGMDGIALTERLRHDFPNCAVIILSLYDEPSNRERAAKAGASAFVSKQRPDGMLVNAIRNAVGKTE